MAESATGTDVPSREQSISSEFSQFGEKAKVAFTKKNRLKVMVRREDLVDIATFVRQKLMFDHCTNVTGTDFPKEKELEITYHFGSTDGAGLRGMILSLACRVPSGDPTLPSLISIFPSADYHERETAEMIGAIFTGHPKLGRFMLPEDWSDIPPMLKAYRLPGRLEAE